MADLHFPCALSLPYEAPAVTHAALGVTAHKSTHIPLKKKENNNSLFKANTRAAKLGEYFPYSHSSPLAIIVFQVLQKT